MRVVLIRHGETASNALGRYLGATDEPLSDRGRENARRVPPDPSVKTVFVSPLRRARETAALLFPNAEQVCVDGLREMDFGAFEGRSSRDMEHDPDYRAWVDSGCTAPCPGGEDMAGFAARTGEAFTALLRTHADTDPLVIVAHGGTLMAVFSLFAQEKRAYWEWGVKNLEGRSADVSFDENGVCRLTRAEEIRR